MKGWKKYVLLGVATYLIVLVVRFPAETAYAIAKPTLDQRDAPVELFALSGSVWEGRAGYAELGGQPVRNLKWELHPLEVLIGRTAMDVSFQNTGGNLSASVARTFGGNLKLKDVNARIGAADLISMLRIPAVKLDGRFNLKLTGLEVVDNTVAYAEGMLVWNGAATRFPQTLALGDLSAKIETTDKGVSVTLADAGGPLEAAGLLLLEPSGAYSFNGSFSAREGVNSMLGRSLNMMGRPGPDGKVQIATSGNVKDFGFLLK